MFFFVVSATMAVGSFALKDRIVLVTGGGSGMCYFILFSFLVVWSGIWMGKKKKKKKLKGRYEI
jgi:hypothetical protein